MQETADQNAADQTSAGDEKAGGRGGKTHRFQAEVSQVLSLVINSLYSNKEIFLRELISNAADALDKLRFRAVSEPQLLPEGYKGVVRLIPDEKARTLTVWDNGIGMTEQELVENLGTVARSGSKAFWEALEQSQRKDVTLIGQFGVGFYSGYLVADRVEVVSRAAGQDKAYRWVSEGKDAFTIEPAERDEVGTSVVLHLRKEHKDYLGEWRLRELVRRYSDFISYPIELHVTRDTDGKKEQRYEPINEANALWRRNPKDISDEQYQELYRHLSHAFDEPLARAHFNVEGKQMFTGLLFIPKRPPFDMFAPEARHGVRLYVKRVFIMDDCEDLLPRWLRFVRGVVDSEDLPLNVSRELLQDSAMVRTIRKQVVRRVLNELDKVASKQPEDYADFWRKFGPVIKEGLHLDPEYRDRIVKLARFESTQGEGLTSLADYVSRMPEAQKAIYYAIGPSRRMLETSPHLEGLKKRGYEVLLLTDGIDQWAVDALREHDGKPLVNAMQADLDLDGAEGDERKEAPEPPEAMRGLLERFKETLEAQVSEVRVSERLTDSPVCLVIPKGGLPSHIERMLKTMQSDLPETKRILEINPDHPLIQRLQQWHAEDPKADKLTQWIELLHDQALLTEGSPIHDPARFAARLTQLMQEAAGQPSA